MGFDRFHPNISNPCRDKLLDSVRKWADSAANHGSHRDNSGVCRGACRAGTAALVEPADLRTHLRNNLIVEFQQELHSKAALTADQRQALSDLVTNNLVTSPRSARRGRRNYFVGRFPRVTKHSC